VKRFKDEILRRTSGWHREKLARATEDFNDSMTLIASFQHGVLESRFTRMFPEASRRTWMPAIRAGMTKSHFLFSAGERKFMEHFA